jgi:hypothetical protein
LAAACRRAPHSGRIRRVVFWNARCYREHVLFRKRPAINQLEEVDMRTFRRRSARQWFGRHATFLLMATATTTWLLAMVVGPLGRTVRAQSIPADTQGGCPVPAATFATWFESGVPALDGVVKPADSVNFPGVPNCDFYSWSQQMFLWLTSPAPSRYGGGSRIFNSPTFFDVSPPDANGVRSFSQHEPGFIRFFRVRIAKPGPTNLPVVFDKRRRMFEVQRPKLGPTGNPVVLNRLNKEVEVAQIKVGANKKVAFLDKENKPIPAARLIPVRDTRTAQPIVRPAVVRRTTPIAQMFVIDRRAIFVDLLGNLIEPEEGQAGTDAALMSQNKSLVYFATMVNDVYTYFLTGHKNNAFSPAFTTFPTTAAHLAKIVTFAATKGVTFPDPNALAIEVKTAWVEASTLPNQGDYITARATVPSYDTTNPANWVPNGTKNVTLALVSVHVVGSTLGHPEMIWATFEHFGTTPNATYSYNSTTGPKTVTQTTAGTWLLSATGSTGQFNCEHMTVDLMTGNIVAVQPPGNCAPPVPGTISPSDTLRKNPWGMAGGSAVSNTQVISVHNTAQVPGNDIRNKYFMTGATWTPFGINPTPTNGVGTNKLANSALETYTQDINCFGCHLGNMLGDPGGGGLSHIFGPLKKLF